MAPSGTELALLLVQLPLCRYMSNFTVRNSDTRERLKVKNIYQDTRAEFLCVVFED
jgi:hypothetical protein